MPTTTFLLGDFYQTYFHTKKESLQFYFIMSLKTLTVVRLMKVGFTECYMARVTSESCTVKILVCVLPV